MADKITKADLVDKINENKDLKVEKKDISLIITLLIDEIKDSLKNGNTIELRGLGTFNLKYSKRETARNPKTGEVVKVKPHYKANFVPGKELTDSLKEEITLSNSDEK